ncbi:MAG: double-strand break repair protein AddB [Pseudomonadota bacterium]
MAIFDLQARPVPRVFALPPGRPFFDDVARALLREYGEVPEVLARGQIYVPSRRAVRALKESFARLAPAKALLLPRMTAIADLSEDDVISAHVERQAPPVPDAPSPVTKRLVLAQIYRDAQAKISGVTPDWPAAMRAAGELSRTSDLLTEYDVTPEKLTAMLRDAAIDEGAAHWRDITQLLSIVTEEWPRWLSERGMIDARSRRIAILNALAMQLKEAAQRPFILAAGFLGTTPSSEHFLARVAALPNGGVVLPALDSALSDEAWSLIEAPHPQSAYQHLLDKAFGLARKDVVVLSYDEPKKMMRRRELLSLALMPAEATHTWVDQFRFFQDKGDASAALDGLHVAVAPSSEDEADWIALALREVLETPGKTGALVTADRILARRVAAKLNGWGIEIDDSGGRPLLGAYRATLLRAIARLMDDPSDPVAMATLIHHQLFSLGMDAAERRPKVQACDRFLRGRRPRQGWDGILASLDDDWRPFRGNDEEKAAVASLLGRLRSLFETHDPGPDHPFADRLTGHISLACALCALPGENGRERLFRFEDGEALERHFDQMRENPEALAPLEGSDYPALFDALLATAPAYRPPGGQHPRLSVYGILEARLQQSDLLVVGGLQEGIWPGDEVVDPFLSRHMRSFLSIPSPEAEVGRVAHDFLDFAASPNVLLTRAERQGTSVARPSRFMVRLESFLKVLDPDGAKTDASIGLRSWQRARYGTDQPVRRAPRPTPRPPVEVRPTRFSISAAGRWLRDPYAIYAEKILRLRRLAPYDEAYGPALRGMLLHAWAEETVSRSGDHVDDIAATMAVLKPEILDRFDYPHDQRVLGVQFLEKVKAFFPVFHAEALQHGNPLALEVEGMLELEVGVQTIEISGRADRIDRCGSGVHIIDYKTGDRASLLESFAFDPQLFLLGLMSEQGGFKSIPALAPEQISLVLLTRENNVFHDAKDASKRSLRGEAFRDRMQVFRETWLDWLARQYDPDTAFPSQVAPFKSTDEGDYDELARRSEWMRGADDDEH